MLSSQEKIIPFDVNTSDDNNIIFARMDLDRPSDFLFLKGKLSCIPILYKKSTIHHSRYNLGLIDGVIEQHIKSAEKLADMGFDHLAIALDNDGIWQKWLSPRFTSADFESRIKPLCSLFLNISKIIPNLSVFLTIEELAPGGMDATDGIKIAQTLEEHGLKNIIVSSGTKDFMPLYDRRITHKKISMSDNFYSNEPALASALWVLEHTSLNVFCAAFFDNKEKALAIAQKLGLSGLIEKAPITDE